jgi:hypothetical protein
VFIINRTVVIRSPSSCPAGGSPMAGGSSMAGDDGPPHRDHHSSPNLNQSNEMLRANSPKQQKLATTSRTRRAATRGRRRHYHTTVSFKNTVCIISTKKKSTKRQRRKMRSHQSDENGLTFARKPHPRSTETVHTALTLELDFPWLAYRLR